MTRSTSRRSWRILGALAAAAALGFAAAAPAAAAPLPDADQVGSLTIHKFETPPGGPGAEGDGTLIPGFTGTPVPGVEVTVQQVDPASYDLSTNAGWQALTNLTPAIAAAGPFGQEATVTTGADGVATAADLPLGVYLVTETSWPAGFVPAEPFLVTIPLTDPVNLDDWLYDVHVYPKNAATEVTKTVEDSDAYVLGDAVTWTIRGSIPQVDVIDGYRITDQLDDKLQYDGSTVELSNGVALTEGTDYTRTFDAATNTLTIDFTEAGRAVLVDNSDAQVVVTLETTVTAVGEITNTAVLYPNEGSFDIEPGEPGGPIVTPEEETKWGNVSIRKTDARDTSVNLQGAVFSVYLTEQDARDGVNAITIGGTDTWTTDGNGELTISGLRYSGWADGAAVAPGDPGYQSYWLVEVAAPTGYELLAEPVEVIVDGTDTVVDYTIENSPHNGGFTLPLTGGTLAEWFLYGAGAALLGGAALLMARRAKRSSVQ